MAVLFQDSSISMPIQSRWPIQGQDYARLTNSQDDLQPCSSNTSPHTPVNPNDILPLPKAPPRKNTTKKRKAGSTRILTNTPVRNEIEKEKQQRAQRNKKTKRKLIKKVPKKIAVSAPQESSEEDDAMPVPLADSSDDDCGLSDDDIMEGDFVVVNVKGKARVIPYIARIDSFEDDEYEGVFLKKIQSCGNFDKLTFFIDENDEASFTKIDIVQKLPLPHFMSGSARKSHQLYFNANLSTFGF